MNDSTLNAVWCVNSETGEEVLIDRKTNKVIARKENKEWEVQEEKK